MTSVSVNGASAKGGACRHLAGAGADSRAARTHATLLECAPRALAQGQQHALAGLRGAGLRGANSLCGLLTPESGLAAAVAAASDAVSRLAEVALAAVPPGGEPRAVACKRALLAVVRACVLPWLPCGWPLRWPAAGA
jgi:hypothetical protein